jgi:excinuclease ABC subunit B
MFKLASKYKPNGSQPQAIKKLTEGILSGKRDQVLLGVTGSGKTFTMANVIAELQKPALIMVHNKTLAAQVYGEMKEFFPENAVEYFVSYYDYYQPEAYIAKTDTYIEKDSSINEQLDLLRHSATVNLLERRDAIVVSSVSCIYGIGKKENYLGLRAHVKVGEKVLMDDLLTSFIDMQYEREGVHLERGKFRVKGDVVDIYPCHLEEKAWRIEFFGKTVDRITEIDPLTGQKLRELSGIVIYPSKHFATPFETIKKAVEEIKRDLEREVKAFYDKKMIVEAKRLEQRTNYDIEMLLSTGMCKGIENYSRYMEDRAIGSPPATLLSYLPADGLLFIDESHITVPQVGAMYEGDRSRKSSLVGHGFRMLSALDNRPLKLEEWEELRGATIFVSATPGKYEMAKTEGEVVEQIIRPTGLLDPICEIRPVEGQVEDLVAECKKMAEIGKRVLALTLTKKMAERLDEFLKETGLKSAYLHSEINTFERVDILNRLRSGEIDVIVGINLLREGIDIPECGLVAILDADKEGFLRNETSLIQMIGRAARNDAGRVVLYADKETKSIKASVGETVRRRQVQEEYNRQNGITPTTVIKEIKTLFDDFIKVQKGSDVRAKLTEDVDVKKLEKMTDKQIDTELSKLRKAMKEAAKKMEFELAKELRDKILLIQKERL